MPADAPRPQSWDMRFELLGWRAQRRLDLELQEAVQRARQDPPKRSEVLTIPQARAYAESAWGLNWQQLIHFTHRPSLARPVVYCRTCGRYAETVATVRDLGNTCRGDPPIGSAYRAKLRWLTDGRHPATRELLDSRPVPLPLGTKR